jgi:IS30 family transposase
VAARYQREHCLLREYFPKKTDFRTFTTTDLAAAEDRLNHRPRKRHGWRTPAEVFAAALRGR